MSAHSSNPPEPERDQLGFAFPEESRAETRQVWPVGELVSAVRGHIEREYPDVRVQGEISNCRAAPSGHLYFTLKDDAAQLPVVMFRAQARLLRFRPQDGLAVLARGRVSVYEQRGQMQLIAELLEPMGAGSLQLAFEQLKAKLLQEGLFAQERKRPMPAFPRCIGIVTSPTGAVIQDFLNVGGRRHAALNVLLYPAQVQGEAAAAEIAAGIAWFNRTGAVDVIVIARGGGSLEDLAPFNSESLARAIAQSELPVVSAVGHETDFTIADFVADLRAPTPSAAAEILTEAQHRVAGLAGEMEQRLLRACRFRLMKAAEGLSRLAAPAVFRRTQDALARRQQRMDELQFRLEAAWRMRARHTASRLDAAAARLLRQDATHRLRMTRERLTALGQRLGQTMLQNAERKRARHAYAEARLTALSPLAVLERGYALVFDESGTLLKNAAAAQANGQVTARLARGRIRAQVIEIEE